MTPSVSLLPVAAGATRAALALAIALASAPLLAEESADTGEVAADELAPVTVTAEGIADTTEGSGSYAAGRSRTATGMALSAQETPQSTSTVTRTQMDDFGLDNINEVLASTTGVVVEKVETDRTYYSARGFDITNFQVDGQGVPFVYGNVIGDLDTAQYDRIEVLRGANGLMSGTGSPSATINFIRKRPTTDFQGSAALSAGSWDTYRADIDVSNRLNDDGSIRGRVVGAYEDGHSYLDRYQKETGVTYGILEFDLGDATTLAVGGSYQNNNTRSPLWGALPLYRTDGTQTDYDVETSTSADWSYWNGEYTNAFVELTHGLGGGWEAQATLTHREMMSDSKLFYVYGTPNPDTPQSDLFAYPSRYELDNNQFIGDLRVSGPYQLFGREHQAVVGASYWESDLNDLSRYGQGIGTPIVDLEFWTGDYPEPAFDASVDGSNWVDRQKSAFAATQFRLTDELAFIGGARVISLTSRGTTYGTSKDTEYSDETVPYAGLVLDITDNVSAYASYAEIFDPQTEIDINRDRIDPIEGTTRELGLKSAFYGGAVQTTVAVFETEQDNLAEAAGTIPASVDTFYIGVDGIESRGYEVDVSGEVLPGLQVAAGFTSVNINGPEGDRARTFTPERIARLSTAYQLRSIERLKVGASINWQDDIYRYEGVATTGAFAGAPIYVRQDSYARVNLMARYDVTSRFNAQLNLNNVTDEKYLTSLYWSQGYYGAPRNASLKLNWAF